MPSTNSNPSILSLITATQIVEDRMILEINPTIIEKSNNFTGKIFIIKQESCSYTSNIELISRIFEDLKNQSLKQFEKKKERC